MMPSDRDLLARFTRGGDRAALRELIERHSGMVYSVCLRMLGDARVAEEASQAVFLVLIRKARTRLHHSSPTLAGWLMHAAYLSAKAALHAAPRKATQEQESAESSLEEVLVVQQDP
jgi:DNA-directed RNA polymerase specialized sigma24 family protein